jgi:hypothetical protein
MISSDIDKRMLYNQMREVAIARGYISSEQASDKVARHNIMTALVSQFEAAYRPIPDFETPTVALNSWINWLDHKPATNENRLHLETISLTVTVNYGGVSIGIGIEDEFEIENDGTRYAILRMLRDVIDGLHREQAITVNKAIPPSDANSAGDTVTIPITAIRKENSQGKDRLRAIGGQWSTHGVPLYIEALSAAGLTIEEFAYGDTPKMGKAIVALRANGNPLKVLELIL